VIPLPQRFEARAVILSPIMREIDPRSLPPCEVLLAADLQGFVREPSQPSRHVSQRFDLRELVERCDVVKASSDEIALLTDETRSALHGTLILETRGVRGVLLHQAGDTQQVAAIPVRVTESIGAGDTYLAAFVVAMMNGASPVDAGERAARFTEDWLRRTKIHVGAD
jgi:sugar/nucleoside kinase (ribokinase family)